MKSSFKCMEFFFFNCPAVEFYFHSKKGIAYFENHCTWGHPCRGKSSIMARSIRLNKSEKTLGHLIAVGAAGRASPPLSGDPGAAQGTKRKPGSS